MALWQSKPMHWQTYTTSAPLTRQLEEAFRRQAAMAFRNTQQTMGYSVSSSFTTRNGVTTGSTQLQVGKSTPWTPEEVSSVERYLVGLIPKGDLIGPSGRPVGYIEAPPPPSPSIASSSRSASSSKTLKPRKSKSAEQSKNAPPLVSFPSTVSEAGTVPPSTPPAHMVLDPMTPHSPRVHYEDLPYDRPPGRFSTITKRFRKKTSASTAP
ncbi:uncharacterized protein I303_103887 [Kwoniella dejecticola CBS 10117]|uniref:Uncharacterized protein n=1 Tax=Kwoniella dejecticola CBS 10117 TaxID=1296121 RepID=A0A1A6A803_9TREE|nr:uncharacterized protein I303_03906 [Kwoniella dejecticola CBS 10117]OBR86186.1 hypothetical protein I303_03906 [Kwoniella dejecticola CBS 10117]